MDTTLADFAALLRANGLRLSPSEVAEAVQAAALVGIEERGAFRGALRATMVKRTADVPAFEALFDHYFRGGARLLARVEKGILAALEEEGILGREELGRVARALSRAELSPLARAAVNGDAVRLARLLRAAVLRVDGAGGGAVGFQTRRLLAAAGAGALRDELDAVAESLRREGMGADGLRLLRGELEAALRRVEDALRRMAEERAAARTLRRRDEEQRQALRAVSPEEAVRLDAAVRRLAERLKTRLRRRDGARRRGLPAVRRTLRRNLGLGGVPARLVFRPRRPHRPELVVLCDVSESVRHATRLMLLFLHALQARFARIRTFVFVSDLGEVTEALRQERDPARAADLALAARAVNLAQNTNTGRALAALLRLHGDALSRRTTVLVIGDGRNNYQPAEAWALGELRRRARRVLWMCPEPRRLWGTGDSDMPRYAEACDRAAEVTTLAELEGIAAALVPG